MFIINLISFLVLITILVVIHELGHFLAAKSIGLKVEKFYVGFNLFGLGVSKKIGETEFGIGLFPIGGYVKVAGMVDENFDDNYKGEEDEYINKGTIQKLWFTSGGVIFNFILAFLLFSSLVYFDGLREPIPTINTTIEGMPASEIDLIEGDKILRINDKIILSWEMLSENIRANPNQKISIQWERKDHVLHDSILVSSRKLPSGDEIGVIGIEPKYEVQHLDLLGSLSFGFNQTTSWIKMMFSFIYSFFTGKLGIENFGGPIQIAKIAGEASQVGILAFVNLMAILSINLGVINILPFPGLDGGHAMIAMIEGVLGKRIPFNVLIRIQTVGVILLAIFFFIVLKNDVLSLF